MHRNISTNLVKEFYTDVDILPKYLRVAAFDLDDTLIYHKYRKNEWKLLDDSIIYSLCDLFKKKYAVVIFSNQASMKIGPDTNKWISNSDYFLTRLRNIYKGKIIFAIYAALKDDIYRKPNIGMWTEFIKDIITHVPAPKKYKKIKISSSSFFCGDAAGRQNTSVLKKKIYPSSNKGDFSDSDYRFALNIGINFITPDKFIYNINDTPTVVGFNPKYYNF